MPPHVVARKKRKVSQRVESCTCAPGSKGRTDVACSGCQNNLRRKEKRKK